MKSRAPAEIPADTPEQLIAGLHNLLEEAEHMVAATGDVALDKIDSITHRLAAAEEKLRSLYGSARGTVVEGARRFDDSVRTHPYQSLAIAAGVGVLLGLCLCGSRSRSRSS